MKQKKASSAVYTPSENEGYMTSKQLEYFKNKLLKWKEDLKEEARQTIEHLREEPLKEPDENDRASVESETVLELRTRGRCHKLISQIDMALARIEDGSYGYCEETSNPIGIKRLEARPIATLCIEAQERREKYERQHSED
jgi:DnaK suppressor protein